MLRQVIQIAILFSSIHTLRMRIADQEIITRLASGSSIPDDPDVQEMLSALDIAVYQKDSSLYLSPSMELLSIDRISALVQQDVLIETYLSIDSTNRYLMEEPAKKNQIKICLSEQQTAGKGRRGRNWVSPFGKNIYMSMGKVFEKPMADLEGLSLVVGMQVVKTLRGFGLEDVYLKWPNDIILGKGKLAGILIELSLVNRKCVYAVLGIGINFEMNEQQSQSIDQPWSAIKSVASLSRNEVAGTLINHLLERLVIFEQFGFSTFRDDWNSLNLYFGKNVCVHQGDEVIDGIDAGVDEKGNLLLRVGSELMTFNAGQVSLRPSIG
ncbi:MAG: biotin--[acetyl-CoA-carboxylase] ligase [Pseudomonadales bacterium]